MPAVKEFVGVKNAATRRERARAIPRGGMNACRNGEGDVRGLALRWRQTLNL